MDVLDTLKEIGVDIARHGGRGLEPCSPIDGRPTVGLRVTTSDASFDEEVGQFAERVQFQCRYLLRFQRLVFCQLLAQVSQLRLDALAHGEMKT